MYLYNLKTIQANLKLSKTFSAYRFEAVMAFNKKLLSRE